MGIMQDKGAPAWALQLVGCTWPDSYSGVCMCMGLMLRAWDGMPYRRFLPTVGRVGACATVLQSVRPHLTWGHWCLCQPDLKGRQEAESPCLIPGWGVPTGTMRLRSACPRPAWCCCPNLSLCCSGPSTVTTCCTRAWWRSLSPTCCGPSPVSALPLPPQPHVPPPNPQSCSAPTATHRCLDPSNPELCQEPGELAYPCHGEHP